MGLGPFIRLTCRPDPAEEPILYKADPAASPMGTQHTHSPPAPMSKRRYVPPRLVRYGDVRYLTQGGAGTQWESLNPAGNCRNTSGYYTCASDSRVKQDLLQIGQHPLGFGLYLFYYKPAYKQEFGPGRQFGVLADEVEAIMPQAVGIHQSGFKTVDYGMLGVHRTGGDVPLPVEPLRAAAPHS